MTHEAKVSEKKKKIVGAIANYIKEYPIVGIINMENLPARQLQKLRAKLRDKIFLLMTKKRLIKKAIELSKSGKPGLEQLEGALGGMPALIFTKESPFRLSSILRKNRSKAPIKSGQISPNDIVVHAGPTPFPPGPIISELSQAGIKTGVEAGKVTVKQDCLVAKEGEKVKPKVADVLSRLGIHPIDVGIDITAVYENGTVFWKDVLSIDEASYIKDMQLCWSQSLALAAEIAYTTEDTIKFLISGSYAKANALAGARSIQPGETKKEEKAPEKVEKKTTEKVKEKIPEKAEEIKREEKAPEKVEEAKKEEKAPEKKAPKKEGEEKFFEEVKEKMKKDEEIKQKLEEIEKKEKTEDDHKKIEMLADELKRKGTLKED